MRIRPAALVLLSALLAAWSPATLARELKVATWDLGWLTLRPAGDPGLPERIGPKSAADLALLARYAAGLAADVVAFQGVDGPLAAGAVFPAADYAIAMSGDAVLQRSGFAVRRGVAFQPAPDFAALDPYPNARFRLRSGAQILLFLPGGCTLRLMSAHLKSGCRAAPLDSDDPACVTLARQADALGDWVAARDGAGEPFLLLGDFGRIMDGDDSFIAKLGSTGTLLRATEHRASPCWGGGNFVDHIIAGGAARGWTKPDTLRVMAFRETGSEWRARLSEHCPVSVRLQLPD